MFRMNSIRAVLFDWDGTLLDSYRADTQAYLEMFHALGIGWGLDDLARHYSPDWHRVYRAARLPEGRWGEADRLWLQFYRRHRPVLLPGARRVLRVLHRRVMLALVTSGDRTRVVPQLRRLHLASLFAVRVCGQDTRLRKPHPAPLELAMRRLGLRPAVCVYVGDSPDDVEMARRAGVHAVAVRSAFSTLARLRRARPAAVLSSVEKLPGLLAASDSAGARRC